MRLNNRALQAAVGEILKILADIDRRITALEEKNGPDKSVEPGVVEKDPEGGR